MIARASPDGPSGGGDASAGDDDSVSSTGKALQSVNVAGVSLFGGVVFGAGRGLGEAGIAGCARQRARQAHEIW